MSYQKLLESISKGVVPFPSKVDEAKKTLEDSSLKKKKKRKLVEAVQSEISRDEEKEELEEEQLSENYESDDEGHASIDHYALQFDEAYSQEQKRLISLLPTLKPEIKDFGIEYAFEDKSRQFNEFQYKNKLRKFVKSSGDTFDLINSYSDILMIGKSEEEYQDLYSIHLLNHVLKTRSKILKNNEKLKEFEGDIRDQGFTRPKVLILLPMKHMAYKIIEKITKLVELDQINKARYQDEFGLLQDAPSMDNRPEDYRKVFEGNNDDCFRIGLKFTRKTVKFYSDFYSSDIIIASPLGLRIIIGTAGEKKRDYDFLSSIEILIVDYTAVLLMQNWDHVMVRFPDSLGSA